MTSVRSMDLEHASVEQLIVAINTSLSGICKDSDYAIDAQEFLEELSRRLFRKSIRDLTKQNLGVMEKVQKLEEDYIR